jgi:hypothetical protein
MTYFTDTSSTALYDATIDVYDVPDALNPEVPQDTEVFMNGARVSTYLFLSY